MDRLSFMTNEEKLALEIVGFEEDLREKIKKINNHLNCSSLK